MDDAASVAYAEIVTYLRRAGAPVATNGVWIAALAAREGLPVLTYDAQFQMVARVSVRLLGQAE